VVGFAPRKSEFFSFESASGLRGSRKSAANDAGIEPIDRRLADFSKIHRVETETKNGDTLIQ
jgi:hypothetical protein